MALTEKKFNLRQRLHWVPEVFSLLFAAKIGQQEKNPLAPRVDSDDLLSQIRQAAHFSFFF